MPPEATPADEQLMHDFAAGNAHAFEMLYDRHHLRLWRYLYRSLGEPASADELAQDVWFSVARAAPRYHPSAAAPGRPVARFGTWLFTLAHHRLVDHLRARRPHASLDAESDDGLRLVDRLVADSGFGPVRRIETKQQAAQLLAALDALPAPQREAFLLQAEGGLGLAEIAEATGVGLETTKSRLRYARAALRRTLEQMA